LPRSEPHWRARTRAAGGVGEGGNAEVDGLAAAGGDLVHLCELGLGAGEADLQAFGLAEPALGFGFGDAGDEVVADLDQAGSGGGVWAQQRAAQAPLTELVSGFGQVIGRGSESPASFAA
jgi:hypothetical protein